MKLYEITESLDYVTNQLEQTGGEITPELDALINTTSRELEKKSDNIVTHLRILEDQLELVSKRKKEIQNLEKSIKSKIDYFKEYILSCMKRANIKKIDGPFSRITVRKPVKALYVDEDKIASKYHKIITAIDKQAIKKDLDNGIDVEGAYYIDGKESVLAKLKG